MGFVISIGATALIYAALAKTLLVAVDSIRRRRWLNLLVLLGSLGLVGLPIAWQIAAFCSYPVALVDGVPMARQPGISDWLLSAAAGMATGALLAGYLAGVLDRGKLTWQDEKRRKELSRQIRLHLALVTGAVVFSVPFYWLVTTSLKPDERTNMFPPDLIPMQQRQVTIDGQNRKVYLLRRHGTEMQVAKMAELENDVWEVAPLDRQDTAWTAPSASLRPDLYPVALWSNYSDALRFLPPEYNRGLRPLWNTVYVTLLVMLGTVLSSSLVAFSFARLRWPGRDLLFVVLLATMMIPPAVTMLPVFLIFRALDWVDTLKPLWVPALFGGAFNVFLLRQFFMTIPNDLEDAAKIDGCGYFTIYWRIMLPLIKPALAAITIFAFMGSWNNFMGPLIYISSPEKMTLAYALQLFQGAHGGEPSMMMAAATLVMLPVLVVFFFTQRYMIQGVTLTGMKG